MTYLPYPEPRYHGETGETGTAAYRPNATEPDLTSPGASVHYLATGANTEGQLGLYRWEMSPQRGGPPPHFHRSITESFYILSGNVQLYDGVSWVDGEPGDFVYVPQGGVHSFRNESGKPASMLLLFTPGAPREGYFEGLASGSVSDEDRAEFFLSHDTFWV